VKAIRSLNYVAGEQNVHVSIALDEKLPRAIFFMRSCESSRQGPSTGYGWRKGPLVTEGSREYIEETVAKG
jgi:hypothetical protein